MVAHGEVCEAAAHLVNPPHRLGVGREQQDGAVVTTISTSPWSCSMRTSSYWIGSPLGVAVGAANVEEVGGEESEHILG